MHPLVSCNVGARVACSAAGCDTLRGWKGGEGDGGILEATNSPGRMHAAPTHTPLHSRKGGCITSPEHRTQNTEPRKSLAPMQACQRSTCPRSRWFPASPLL